MNRNKLLLPVIVLSLLCLLIALKGQEKKTIKKNLTWQETDTTLALLNNGRVVWQHVHDKKTGKPFMRIGLPDGTEMTRPWPFKKDYPKPDHVWHKALWWSWKYIDGINFWEKHQTGTVPVKVQSTRHENGQAVICLNIAYQLPGQTPLVKEKRTINVSPMDDSGTYLIDWRAEFSPGGKKDVVFNKNSYGGFSIRMAAEYCGDKKRGIPGWVFFDNLERKQSNGKKANWVAYRGKAQNGQDACIALFDHPGNPRFPTLWQTRTQYPYMNPSFTCKEDYTLKAGETLTLRYGVLVYNGQADHGRIEVAWKKFAARE